MQIDAELITTLNFLKYSATPRHRAQYDLSLYTVYIQLNLISDSVSWSSISRWDMAHI